MRGDSIRGAQSAGLVATNALLIIAALGISPAAAQTAAAVVAASAPLQLRRDDPGDSFPVGGAVLLAVLVIVAGFVAWSRKRLVSPSWSAALGIGRAGAAAQSSLKLQASLRLDGQTRLHIVHWNDREVLVATTGSSAPVVLDRTAPFPPSGEDLP